jgi:hypothetical protein
VGREGGVEGREVWTPMSRWKSSVGSESLSESVSFSPSPAYRCFCAIVGGISDTMDSSREISFERFVDAVSARESREVVREASMGVTR